jgi:hypothetical protein
MKKGLFLVLVVLLSGVAAVGAQEGPPPPPEGPPPFGGPPPPPEGLSFGGSVITGLRYRSWGAGEGYNVFDIEATDDYLVEGDTATLRATLNKVSYGATLAVSFTGNNTQANFWTLDRIYASEVSAWAKILNDKFQAKAGYFNDFDYFTPVNAWNLADVCPTNAVQLTAYPIEGLRIDLRAKTSDLNANLIFGGWNAPNWYNGEEFARNIDVGVKYVNPNFTAFVAFDDSSTASSPAVDAVYAGPPGMGDPIIDAVPAVDAETQANVYGYFAWTGIPKLIVGVESKFEDLGSERKYSQSGPPLAYTPSYTLGDKVGITNATALNVGYQITDAFYARAFFIAGAVGKPGSFTAIPLLGGEDGFSFAVNAEFAYKLNNAFTFFLTPIFQIPDTEDADRFDIFVKPRVAWALGSFPQAATINLWYEFRYFSDKSRTYYETGNGKDNLFHVAALTFGWMF